MKKQLLNCLMLAGLALLTVNLFAQQNASAPQKFALVIGNGNYTSVSKLSNPVNDANDMTAALQSLGFTVEKVLDGDLSRMENAVSSLKNRLKASKNSYGFFFYAGHGVQSNGINYLLPVNANIPGESYLGERALSVQAMLGELNEAGNDLNIIVLDACRDNPFGWSRSGTRGLSVVSAPVGTIIMYATSANAVASDGTGRNGLFTTQLLNNLKTPGLSVRDVFDKTGEDVLKASGGKQHPELFQRYFSASSAYLGSRPAAAPALQPTVEPVPEGLECERNDSGGITITEYRGSATSVVIPSRITGLPVTTIGYSAFYSCHSLTSVTIPSSVTTIERNAFRLSGLTSISIPSSVTTIASAIPNNGLGAFDELESLTSFIVDNRNPAFTSIDGVLFDKSMRTLIKYPAGRTADDYVIPSTVTTIGKYAFDQSKLKSVTIPSSVTTIETCAFDMCSLTSVNIPSSVISIGENIFMNCSRLISINVDSFNSSYASIDGVLFDKNIRTLVKYPQGKTTGVYAIPSSVTTIEECAFWACRHLTSINVPSSVTSIRNNTFYACHSLTSISIPSSVTTIGNTAFSDCESLTSITIPSSVTTIGYLVFSGCKSLTNISIPSSVMSIGFNAFSRCENLTSITLSRRTQVGEGAFPETARITYRD